MLIKRAKNLIEENLKFLIEANDEEKYGMMVEYYYQKLEGLSEMAYMTDFITIEELSDYRRRAYNIKYNK